MIVTIDFSPANGWTVPQDQDTEGWPVNGQGVSKAGDHTTSAGSKCQIITDAGYPGGSGYGHRYWIGPGDHNNSGGIDFDFGNMGLPNTLDEVWVRWYVRWEAGLDLNDSQKVLYSIGFGTALEIYWDIGDNNGAVRVVSAGDTLVINQDFGWFDINGGSDQSDGEWHCFEVYFHQNGAGSSTISWWIDDVLRLHADNLTFNVSDEMGGFGLPANQRAHNIVRDYYNDTSDIVISTEGRIGPIEEGDVLVTPDPADVEALTANPAVLASALSQHSFRWRDDTGSESAASWLAAQGANISRGKRIPTRLRFLVDGTANPPPAALQVEFRKVGDPDWEKIN